MRQQHVRTAFTFLGYGFRQRKVQSQNCQHSSRSWMTCSSRDSANSAQLPRQVAGGGRTSRERLRKLKDDVVSQGRPEREFDLCTLDC